MPFLQRRAEPDAVSNAINYTKFRGRSHDAVIRVYDNAGSVIEVHEQAGEFKEPLRFFLALLTLVSLKERLKFPKPR